MSSSFGLGHPNAAALIGGYGGYFDPGYANPYLGTFYQENVIPMSSYVSPYAGNLVYPTPYSSAYNDYGGFVYAGSPTAAYAAYSSPLPYYQQYAYPDAAAYNYLLFKKK